MVNLLLAFLFLLWIIVFHQWSRREGGPKAWPVVGAAVELGRNYDRLYDWIIGYLGEKTTLAVPMPFSTYFIITDPANVQHVLKTNFANYPKGDTFHSVMDELLGDGIFNADGETWREQRKTASFEFASRNLREFSSNVFREFALKLCSILSQACERDEEVDMQDLLMRMTLDAICKVGFGTNVGTLDPSLPQNPFAKAFDTANLVASFRFADPLWKLKRFLNVGTEAHFRRSLKVIDDFSYSLIRRRQAEDLRTSDILSRFVAMSKDDEYIKMKEKKLRDTVINFVIAGRDTTAATLAWAVCMVMKHEHVAEKLLGELTALEQENFEFLQVKPSSEKMAAFARLLTYESLGRLHYLHAVISETLRLYPPVPLDPKGVVKDDVLPDGTVVKAGDSVYYSPYVMGRMENNWGADAAIFNPERWLKEGIFQPESPFKLCAFQAGPRTCLGKDSAYLQTKMTLALLTRFFKFHLAQHEVNYRTAVILTIKNGLKVSVTRRPLDSSIGSDLV